MTKDDLARIAKNAPKGVVDELWPGIEATMEKYGINTDLRRAHFFAQVLHESAELRYRSELASGSAYEFRRDLGNVNPGDGKKYRGRGLVQLTGRANFSSYGKSLGREKELLEHPELVAEDDVLCSDVAGWFWDTRKLNVLADKDDVKAITKRVNGGFNGLDNRIELLKRAKKVLGV